MITVQNHGAIVLASNFWSSDLALAGKVFCSTNSGAIRVLLPPALYGCLADMRAAKECVLSRGPWPEQGIAEAIEIMWDDGSANPFYFLYVKYYLLLTLSMN